VAVLGLGVSGKSAVRYLLKCGARVLVSDARMVDLFSEEESIFLQETDVELEAGGHTVDFLARADLVVVSPGIDLSTPLIKELRSRDVKIMGELALVAGNYHLPMIAVTGTNGKTTVTSLIGEVLKKSGQAVFVGGNIGTPLYEFLLEEDRYDIVVAEVSSFQLESCGEFAPDVALLLNVSPDHLDRHGSMNAYIEAKMNIFAHQNNSQVAIVNGDDDFCMDLEPDLPGTVQSFGAGKNNSLVIGQGRLFENTSGVKTDCFPGLPDVFGSTAKNYAAAVLALRAVGASDKDIEEGILGFHSLPHRLEYVDSFQDVRYFNDSKATNTGAVLAALEQFEDPIILIAGGRDKGDDFALLKNAVAEKVKTLVVIGEAAGEIKKALMEDVEVKRASSMQDAVALASRLATAGEVVLLSPACASFDMFDSYGQRGDVFKKAVASLRHLAKER